MHYCEDTCLDRGSRSTPGPDPSRFVVLYGDLPPTKFGLPNKFCLIKCLPKCTTEAPEPQRVPFWLNYPSLAQKEATANFYLKATVFKIAQKSPDILATFEIKIVAKSLQKYPDLIKQFCNMQKRTF